MISFEFPIVERTRSLLRLEELFARVEHFIERDHPLDHHTALTGLFEIADAAGRADLKSELLQDLERQKHLLENLRDNPAIAEDALDEVLTDIESAAGRLLDTTGRFGQYLRENEWLASVRQRAGIPGGLCRFDLPFYHQWLSQPAEVRRAHLDGWLAPMLPTRDAIVVLLRLLRDNGKTHHQRAARGLFQQMSGGRVVHMIRVSLDEALGVVPELSANKYALNVRFVAPSMSGERPRTCERDIDFSLTFCKL